MPFDRKALTIVQDAYSFGGMLGTNDTMTDGQASKGLRVLNDMFASYSTDNRYIPYTTQLEFTLTPGKTTYTTGTSGTEDVNVEPVQFISDAKVTISPGSDHYRVMYPISEEDYNQVTNPSSTNRPNYFLVRNSVPNLNTSITFYPTPDQAYTVSMIVKQKLPYVENLYVELTGIPDSYFLALKLMLSVYLLQAENRDVPARLAADAEEKINNLIDNNLIIPKKNRSVSMFPGNGLYGSALERVKGGLL